MVPWLVMGTGTKQLNIMTECHPNQLSPPAVCTVDMGRRGVKQHLLLEYSCGACAQLRQISW